MSEAIIARRRGGGNDIDLSGVNAGPAQVLSPYTYMANNGILTTGTMVNRGSLTKTIEVGNSYSYSAGYYTGGTITASNAYKYKTEVITYNTNWVVPAAKNNSFDVLAYGAGGGGSSRYSCGGGGGWMNRKTLILTPGTSITITIGVGGLPYNGKGDGDSGGTTSFGSYISANGGGGGVWDGGGGSGGSGGSGGGGAYQGGIGYQFGNGGWGNGYKYATNGTNTASYSNVPSQFRGWGRKGNNWSTSQDNCWSAGGGGYGGNGGDAWDSGGLYFFAGGGGGGGLGDGGSKDKAAGIGAGGGPEGQGGNGIVIIQYYG